MPMGISGIPWSRKDGLSLSVDMRWVSNYGYRPVEITVDSAKPTTTDHELTIRLHGCWWSAQQGTIAVEKSFEMPKGSTSVKTTIFCPQYQQALQFFWWEVWIDEVKDEDLSIDEIKAMTSMSGSINPSGYVGLSILTLGPASQDRSLTTHNVPDHQRLSLTAGSFPTTWLGYTCFDVVALSNEELSKLSSTAPEALEAIRQWIHAGGQLWIGDVGPDWQKLNNVNALLRLPADALLELEEATVDTGADSSSNDPKSTSATDDAQEATIGADTTTVTSFEPSWRPYRFRRGNREDRFVRFLDRNTGESTEVRDSDEIRRLGNDPRYMIQGEQRLPPMMNFRGRRRPSDSSRWFVQYPLGLGTIRAFAKAWDAPIDWVRPSANADGGPDSSKTNGGETEPAERPRFGPSYAFLSTRSWADRHGLAPDAANQDFAKLLVPGVGLAPVLEFEVLITLFVLVIGPLNYWLLKRAGRLHLLVLTVPAAAAAMTALLFAYALLSDGFDTTVRARSFTSLDQRKGEAACWTRLSYYAGLAPGNGLVMPDDVAIYPIIPGWNESSSDANVGGSREMKWEDRHQKLTVGWLRSRTPTQYLTVRSRKSSAHIQLTQKNERLEAKNELGAAIQFLVAANEAGELFSGEQLATGAKVTLTPAKRSDAVRTFQQLVVKNQPQAPLELSGEDSDFLLFQRRQQSRASRRFGLQYSNEQPGGNLLERAISDLAGLEGHPALPLPPNSYVAVTQTGPEVVLGVPGAEEEASFHVIFGQW